MNQRLLACCHPTSIPHHIRDYLIRNRVFTFWITSREKEDGVTSSFSAEKRFAQKLFTATPVNIPVIGFWHSGSDPGISEYEGVQLAGLYGKLTVVCDWTTNLSLLSGVRVDVPAMVARYQARPTALHPILDNSKIYLSFDIVESGDAPIYWQAAQHKVWADLKRGTIPIAWSLGPAVIELIPPIIEWYYQHATANDHFYMGLSGACYVHPYRDFMAKTPDPQAAWETYLSLTQYYMDRLDLREISLYTDAWRPFDRKVGDPLTLRFASRLKNLETLILGMGRDEGIAKTANNYVVGSNDVLVSHVITRWDVDNIGRSRENNHWLVNDIRKHTPRKRPAFVHVHPLSWSYYPSDLAEVMYQLGADYVAVSPRDLRRLYLESVKIPSPRQRQPIPATTGNTSEPSLPHPAAPSERN